MTPEQLLEIIKLQQSFIELQQRFIELQQATPIYIQSPGMYPQYPTYPVYPTWTSTTGIKLGEGEMK